MPRLRVLAIDVPIGLPESGARACDQQARALLGVRRSSVFPAPLRGVLGARSWAEACERGERIDGRRMSRQAWAITPKVREVDELLRARPGLRSRVCEVHPELGFRAWKREPLLHAKKTRAGHAERRALVDAHFGADSFPDLRERFRRRDVADDDLLDAFAALWTAERVLRGEARTLPDPPPHDARGLDGGRAHACGSARSPVIWGPGSLQAASFDGSRPSRATRAPRFTSWAPIVEPSQPLAPARTTLAPSRTRPVVCGPLACGATQ